MFCLRSWVPLLIFLYGGMRLVLLRGDPLTQKSSTNASPIYVLLFLTATYLDRRPCVYCSILLFVLVFSLFDFSANWFEPRWTGKTSPVSETATSFISGNSTFTDVVMETASFAVTAINGTGGSLASAAINGIRRRLMNESGAMLNTSNGGTFELLRGVLEKRQLRIPCVDVIIRL